MNHIGDVNKLVSDTPISDSTPHNVGELGMLCRKLERELNAAKERIKRLEEAGDELAGQHLFAVHTYDNAKKHVAEWYKAKEAKP